MDEVAALTPTFTGVSYERLDELGSVQWPCNDAAPAGTPVMHQAVSCAVGAASSLPSMSPPTRRWGRASRCC